MNSAEPSTETEELSGRVLGIISSYGMGAALDARDLCLKTAADAPPAVVRPGGEVRNSVYHAAGHEHGTLRA
jgi:hypothetical protein